MKLVFLLLSLITDRAALTCAWDFVLTMGSLGASVLFLVVTCNFVRRSMFRHKGAPASV
jgi:hypothetical protein